MSHTLAVAEKIPYVDGGHRAVERRVRRVRSCDHQEIGLGKDVLERPQFHVALDIGVGAEHTCRPEAQEALDKLAADKGNMKRFVVAVEGFTDKTGSPDYNNALSQRRANAVVNYLVTKHDIPLFRIYMVGLGSQKPADEGRTRIARSKNRRVEVRIYSADQTMASSGSRSSSADAPTR